MSLCHINEYTHRFWGLGGGHLCGGVIILPIAFTYVERLLKNPSLFHLFNFLLWQYNDTNTLKGNIVF